MAKRSDHDPQLWAATEDIKKILSVLASGGVLTAVTILLGRLWTRSYYGVFGLPTEDLDLSVWDYAFRTKEVLVMLLVGAAVGGSLAILTSARGRIIQNGRTQGETAGRDLAKRVVTWFAQRPLVRTLSGLGALLLSLGLGGLGLIASLAQFKSAWADFFWGSHGILGFLGGVAVGLVLGVLAGLAREEAGIWRAVPAIAILALLTVFLPWSTTELARFKAIGDIRGGSLPQAVIEFETQAPAAIRRSDDPTRSDVVHLVLATASRLAVAYPFGCESVGIQGRVDDGSTGLQTDTCDIFTFDRDDVRSIRVFGEGTQRPFNDEPQGADVVVFAPDVPTEFDKVIDLTAARSDKCGTQSVATDPSLTHGVWYRLDALQSGRLLVDRESVPVYFTALPLDRESPCTETTGGSDQGWRLNVADRVFLLAASPAGDRVEKRLRFTFVPLEFRPADEPLVGPKEDTTQFAVLTSSRIEVTIEGEGAFNLSSDCEPLKTGRVTIESAFGPSEQLALCPEAPPETDARSVTFTLTIPLAEGVWKLRIDLESDAVQAYRIRLTPIELETKGETNSGS